MDIRQLNYFMAIVEEGNISAAAKRLHISQPPLSMQLKLLEQELGTVLLERGSRRVTLTDSGRLLYKHACQIVTLADIAKKELENLGNGTRGILRLGTISSSGTALLNSRMLKYHRENPDVVFEIHEGNTFEMLDLLHHNVIELAMVRTPDTVENMECIYLQQEPMVAVAEPEYFTGCSQDKLTVRDLGGKPLIYYRRYEFIISSLFKEKKEELYTLCKNDDARTTLLWAKAGLGIALVPQSAAEMIFGENLQVRVLDEPKLYTKLGIMFRRDIQLSPAAERFIQTFSDGRKEPDAEQLAFSL